ncbi:hypothetical protein NA56DRAFT_343271 [Hyaloscypha hepaticicola]|uniref:Secreted protein n=1 Tax=Hyaloscypha hepaticicola TaxID=2082293 RepID=A0A2J6QJE3_9HELO|nr:hypothetical protein NA56DRAFT_343271 [Hyaloscypha hepaticicola]
MTDDTTTSVLVILLTPLLTHPTLSPAHDIDIARGPEKNPTSTPSCIPSPGPQELHCGTSSESMPICLRFRFFRRKLVRIFSVWQKGRASRPSRGKRSRN